MKVITILKLDFILLSFEYESRYFVTSFKN